MLPIPTCRERIHLKNNPRKIHRKFINICIFLVFLCICPRAVRKMLTNNLFLFDWLYHHCESHKLHAINEDEYNFRDTLLHHKEIKEIYVQVAIDVF